MTTRGTLLYNYPSSGNNGRITSAVDYYGQTLNYSYDSLNRLVAASGASQSKGEYDFDLHSPDGYVSAVEVTLSVDQTLEETHDAVTDERKGSSAMPTRLCANSWCIHLLSDTRINELRKNADRYLAAIEAAGIMKFWGPTDDRPSVEAIYRDLGVISGSVAPWIKPGNILMSLPGTGGAVGVGTVIEAAEREAFKTDNRKKLGAATSVERHLAVYVDMMTLAWVPLSDFEPTPVLPNLPPEITDIWMFSESYVQREYVLWRQVLRCRGRSKNVSSNCESAFWLALLVPARPASQQPRPTTAIATARRAQFQSARC